MATIALNKLEFFAYHGCFKEEQLIGTRFLVSLSFDFDTREAEISDDLHKTVNYQTVFQVVQAEMEIRSKLLENVAWRIREALIARFPGISNLHITVSKMHPPIGGQAESVSVTLTS